MSESDPIARSGFAEVLEELHELERRVALLERRVEMPDAGVSASAAVAQESAPLPVDATGAITIAGRALLGLAGAYLLRAISESGVVSPAFGAIATVAYALWWLRVATHSAAAGGWAADAYGATAAAILYPMLWETTVRFHAFPSWVTASVLVVFAACAIAGSWNANLTGVVWVTMLSSVASALGLMVATRDVVPFAAALLALVLVEELPASRGRWTGLLTVTSLGADFGVLIAMYVVSDPRGLPETYVPFAASTAIVLGLGLLVMSFGGTVFRTITLGREISNGEIAQLLAAVCLALGGSSRIAHATGSGSLAVALISLAGGAVCYYFAFHYLDRETAKNRNFYAYSGLALLLIASASTMVFDGIALLAIWGVGAVAATWIGNRVDRTTVRLHGVAYLLLACLYSGILYKAIGRLMAEREESAFGYAMPEFAVLAAAALSCAALVWFERPATGDWKETAISVSLAAMLLVPLAGLAGGWILAALPGSSMSIALRTALITGFALALAAAGRRWRRQELVWLVYPAMAFAGYKLLFQDFRYGNTVAFSVSLLFFGGALLLLPRLMKRG